MSAEVPLELVALASSPDDEIDLARAALLIATVEYPRLDVERELAVLDSLAAAASRRMEEGTDPLYRVNTLSEYLFEEAGFRGNEDDYYDPRNSFLNDVLTRRTGIPISLSLVYIEAGKRLGIPLVGVGMPGHFLVRHREVEDLYIDPFYGGILLSEEECAERLLQVTGAQHPWDPRYLDPVGNRELIARMLRNLKAIYLRRNDHSRALSIIGWLLALSPEAAHELRDRGLVHYELGDYDRALDDLRGYLDRVAPDGEDGAIRALVERLQSMLDD